MCWCSAESIKRTLKSLLIVLWRAIILLSMAWVGEHFLILSQNKCNFDLFCFIFWFWYFFALFESVIFCCDLIQTQSITYDQVNFSILIPNWAQMHVILHYNIWVNQLVPSDWIVVVKQYQWIYSLFRALTMLRIWIWSPLSASVLVHNTCICCTAHNFGLFLVAKRSIWKKF